MINLELCKTFKSVRTTNWYRHKPESVRKNDAYKIVRDFEIQTDDLITERRPDIVIINKKQINCRIVEVNFSVDNKVEIKEN